MTALTPRTPVPASTAPPGLADLDPGQPLTERGALGRLPHTCFLNGPPGTFGIELEQLVVPAGPALASPFSGAAPVPGLRLAPGLHLTPARHEALVTELRDLPLACALTVEPGGQVELSSPPQPDVVAAVTVTHRDLLLLRERTGRRNLRLVGVGLDPYRQPQRILDTARYAAMETYFDRTGRAGRLMMCSTASVQVSVEAGGDGDDASGGLARRWRLLHDVGPALVAAFANSPLHAGRPTGWMSSRQAVWAALDARRTRAPRGRDGESVPQAWARWALEAPLLLVRREGRPWTAPPEVTFGDWIRHPGAVPDRPGPTWSDLAYHLTTLFPPVRARGHLEIRYLDAQPDDWWAVPVAVIAALVDDPAVADRALDACTAVRGRWLDAARHAVHDPDLRRAATLVLEAASAGLHGAPATASLGAGLEAYLDRWTRRGRCPADDLLEHAEVERRTGALW